MDRSPTTPTPELSGRRQAEEDLERLRRWPPDGWFYAPNGEPWCRFLVGSTECVNQNDCLNPRHNIPTCKRCGWQWDGFGDPPRACARCKCSKCGWQWPGTKERPDPCNVCKGNLYLEPADPKDPWNVDVRIKRDHWGRYVLPHPLTGKETHFTRVTTAAETLDDKRGLTDWINRMVAYGMAQQPHLVTLAASASGPDDKDTLNQVVKQAQAAAASDRKAVIGTTLHKLTQRIDQGEVVKVPEQHRDRIIRYKTTIAQHRLRFLLDFIEGVVCIPDLGLCGTTDRVAEWHHSDLPVIFDLKTGSLDYAKVAIAQQEAGYSRATHRWDGDRWHEMPEINKEIALVLHLPAETDDEPRLFTVNIAEGWRMLNQSMEVRSLRSGRGKHLFTEITADALPTPSANREEGLRDRITRIKEEPAALQALLGLWPNDMPTLAEGGLSDIQLDLIEGWCEEVEAQHGIAVA